ncbi:proton-coupled folate transporter-like [Pomacea canaliculata]|uniref:proton-coupled folate transporter-like n=1 Tax=Pomacea canaliculata TaxID=400727 RepID=UPI000D72DCA3|nr:proton-coupled folate transporter-like [Pomacea canaliculata]XP_025113349.1 proton-coupled folate transporter-like [Pomacea canaliculata]
MEFIQRIRHISPSHPDRSADWPQVRPDGPSFCFPLPFLDSYCGLHSPGCNHPIESALRLHAHRRLCQECIRRNNRHALGCLRRSSQTHMERRRNRQMTTKFRGGSKLPEKAKEQTDDTEDDFDMSRENQRTFKIVLLNVAHSLSSSIISFVTGYVIQYAGFFYTLIISLGLKCLLFVFAYIFITETGQQRKSSGFITPLKIILRRTRNPRNRRTLFLVNFAVVFTVVSFVVEGEVMRTYQMSPPFCMDSVQLGYLSSESRLKGILTIPVLWMWRRLGLMESTIAAVGLYADIASTLMVATIRKIWVFFVAPIVAIPGSLSSSMTKAISSRLVGRQALASSFAVMLAIDTVFAFAGGQAGNYLYQSFLRTLPTAPFYLASAALAVSAVLYTLETILQRVYAKIDSSKAELHA